MAQILDAQFKTLVNTGLALDPALARSLRGAARIFFPAERVPHVPASAFLHTESLTNLFFLRQR